MEILWSGFKGLLFVAFLPVLMLLAAVVLIGLVIGPPLIRFYKPARDERLKKIAIIVLAAVQLLWCVLRIPSLWWQVMNYSIAFSWFDILLIGAWAGLWYSHYLLEPCENTHMVIVRDRVGRK